ncbi:MAG: STAS domain-containing protein [Lachnospiraceae bacterium]|nr:STAS domain-containing protein [Lachnospiraceae bacterium]
MECGIKKVSAITIDCAKLEYISSAGLRVILESQQYLEENDLEDIKVINTNEIITGILKETGFSNIVNLVNSLFKMTV